MRPNKSQRSAPICDGIRTFHQSKFTVFTAPGHKGGRAVDADLARLVSRDAYRYDVSMMNGIDDRTESQDFQGEAERLAASLYGADRSFFSTNGSSLSVHVALCVIGRPKDEVVVARNSHKSLAAGLIFSGQKPVFVHPEYDHELDLVHSLDASRLDAELTQHRNAKGVVIVNPDYYGFCGDVPTLARVTHRHGLPLVVDEAWGVMFPFHRSFPADAIAAGADLSFGSFHKVLVSLQQASIVHIRGRRIAEDRVRAAMDLFESTSASPLVLASIDAARRDMALHGRKRWSEVIRLSDLLVEQIDAIEGVSVVTPDIARRRRTVIGFDRTKIVMEIGELGITGFEASDWLRENQKITIELADYRRIVAVVSLADTEATARRLVRAIRALAVWASKRRKKTRTDQLPRLSQLKTKLAMTPRDAFFADAESVPLDRAVGRIAAELASPYPPGIPVILPGEVITEAIVQYLREGKRLGMLVPDTADEKLKTLRVVRR